ncbi:MAG: response regulator transcription factor [Flavobacteriales bacterium]|nr:response regulator transcription factor [Flavobacteriales bacterium]
MSYTVFLHNKNIDSLSELSNHLIANGFNVFSVSSIKEAEKQVVPHSSYVFILDISTDAEQADAVEQCIEIRKKEIFNNTILIVYSPNIEDYLQIECFKAGADDYIKKPIRVKLMVSRINALMKRIKNTAQVEHLIHFSNQMVINAEHYSILKNNEFIFLPRKEFEILLLLTTKPGKVFSRDEIVQTIWKKEYKQIGRTIDVHIRKIREKLGDEVIKTGKGVGYKLEEDLLSKSVLA